MPDVRSSIGGGVRRGSTLQLPSLAMGLVGIWCSIEAQGRSPRLDLARGGAFAALFNMTTSVGQIHKLLRRRFTERWRRRPGRMWGFSRVGNIRLATAATAWTSTANMPAWRDPIRCECRIFSRLSRSPKSGPFAVPDGLVGAIRHPDDGLCPARRSHPGARHRAPARLGALDPVAIPACCRSRRRPDDEWVVTTDRGEITCEHVVCATAASARQDRAHGRARHSGHAGGSISISSPSRIPILWRAARRVIVNLRFLRESDGSWYHARGTRRAAARALRGRRAACYPRRPGRGQANTNSFRRNLDWPRAAYRRSAIARVPIFGEVGRQAGL